MPARVHHLPCVVHVHSTYSDGTATVPEILDAARTAGARAVLLCDHNTLGARRDGWEGWHGGVLLLVGHEVTPPPPQGHFLAFGLDREVPDKSRTGAQICADVVRAGGVGFAAHPFSAGSRMSARLAAPARWDALAECPEAGIELWSLATDTAEGWTSPLAAWRELRDPEGRLDGPPAGHLAAWDALGRRRRVPALGGLDAHQPGPRWRGRVRSPMPNRRWFGLLHTVLELDDEPTGDLDADRAGVLAALAAGRALLACPTRGDPSGFGFSAGRGLRMGDEAGVDGQELRVTAPLAADLLLLRDGRPVAAAGGARELRARAEGPGVYRVEARRGGRLWILTNAIYLR